MHINRDLQRAFYEHRISPRELLRLTQEHMLDICATCRKEFHSFLQELHDAEAGTVRLQRDDAQKLQLAGSSPFTQALTQAKKWKRELERLSEAEQIAKVQRARKRFRGPVFGHLMLREAKAATPADPLRALHCSRIAQLATLFESEHRELQVLAVAYQANSHRVLGQDEQAIALFTDLQIYMQHVTDTRTIAQVASFEGSMAMDHRQFSEATQRFTRAVSLYHLVGEQEGEIRNLIKIGANAYYAGRPIQAIAMTREALALITEEESYLYLAARHNLGLFMVAIGEGEEVAKMLYEDLRLYQKHAEQTPHWHTTHAWLVGKVAFVLGNYEQAEAQLSYTRGLFQNAEQDYDAALVGLDLVRLYMARQALDEVWPLVESLIPVFLRYRLAPETKELLEAFEVAVQHQQVGIQLLQRLSLHLEHARRRVGKTFASGCS